MEKWIRMLVSSGRAFWFMGLGERGFVHFDSGSFLPDSSLGIWAGRVFRL